MDLIVLTEFSEIESSLNYSTEEEKSYSITNIEIFFEFPLTTVPYSFLYYFSYYIALFITSPSKQTLEPAFIFLNERIFSFCFWLQTFLEDLLWCNT